MDSSSSTILPHLGSIIAAIGGLGTAAFGLVDASKVVLGGVNNIGFSTIRLWIQGFIPSQPVNGLSLNDVIATLRGNWFTGVDLGSQKAIAKSLIKLNFNAISAAQMAAATGLNPNIVTTIAQKISAGDPLLPPESDVYARFDAIVTAQVDATYRRADDKYVNATRAWAMVAAVALSVAGAWIVDGKWPPVELVQAIFVGLIATPLAPVAKDLSTALATAVNAMQLVKK